MKRRCPNKTCTSYDQNIAIVADGSYFRKCDSRNVQRYRCQICGKRFSKSTFSLAKWQKKRKVNNKLFFMLSSGVSMRRSAILLDINRKTVRRKMIYLAKVAMEKNKKFLKELEVDQVTHMQFDDLITIEHTKMKPLSVSLAVDAKRRFILGSEVSQIAAFGHLAEKSRAKYGQRKSFHNDGLEKLFEKIKQSVSQMALIESDEHTNYPKFVDKYFPKSKYKRYKGGRGCVVGQGELKKIHYDPLFKLNHTCAMLRANINRLIRKTWCTTKDPKMLAAHIEIFTYYYNQFYLN